MNGKGIRIAVWTGIVLAAAGRLVQLATVVGNDGFFVTETAGQRFLSILVYLLIAAAAIASVPLRAAKSLRVPSSADDICVPVMGVFSLFAAAAFAADAVNRIPMRQWLGGLSLLAAVYFVFFAFRAFGKGAAAQHIFAPFALAYPCARLILLFFETFRTIKASENIIEIFGLCGMIVMMIALTKQAFRFEESYAKVLWCVSIYAVFGTLSGPIRLVTVWWGKLRVGRTGKTELAIDIALWAFSIVYLYVATGALKAARERLEKAAAVTLVGDGPQTEEQTDVKKEEEISAGNAPQAEEQTSVQDAERDTENE